MLLGKRVCFSDQKNKLLVFDQPPQYLQCRKALMLLLLGLLFLFLLLLRIIINPTITITC